MVPEVRHFLDAQNEPELYGEYLEDVGQRVGGIDDRRDRDQGSDDERDELPHGDARRVELRDALRVNQARSNLQARQEGRGGPSAALVQELHEADVGADGHDQLRPALLGDENGDVLGEPGRGERLGIFYSRCPHALQAGAIPIRVGVDQEAAGYPETFFGDRVHVAEDQVRLPPGLEQGVGSAVNPDDERPHLPQVRPQSREVLSVVVASHHDEYLAATHLTRQVAGDLEPGEKKTLLVAHELDRVLGEALERRADDLPTLAQPALGGLLVEVLSHGDEFPLLVDAVAPKLDIIPRREPLEDLLADPVQDVDTGPRQDEWPHVRVLAGRGARRVHHGVHPSLHQRLRCDAVEVLMIYHRYGHAVEKRQDLLGLLTEDRFAREIELPTRTVEAETFFRSHRQPSRSSEAWAREASSILPESIRASSRRRSSPSTRRMRVMVRPPTSSLETTMCERASEAIWGRCVMVRTWLRSPSSRSFAPTAVAVSPPMPASTSSKT